MKNKIFIGLVLTASLSLSGCQQVNDMVNKAANSNTTNGNATANTNANSNANANVTANSNANTNTSVGPTNSAANTNTQSSDAAANTAAPTKEETPMTPEVKAFKVDLVGEWKTTDGAQIWRFDENKIESKFANASNFQNPLSYRIVDEKTIEFEGVKATITFENNGNDLLWVNQGGNRQTFKLKRVNPK